jgi:hypothetical protein
MNNRYIKLYINVDVLLIINQCAKYYLAYDRGTREVTTRDISLVNKSPGVYPIGTYHQDLPLWDLPIEEGTPRTPK